MYKSQADAVKEWLKAYRANEDRIDTQLERLRMLRERMMSVGAQRLSDMPRPPSSPKDAMTDYVIQVESLEASIQRDVEIQDLCKKTIVGMVEELKKPEEKVIITDRYLYGMEWNDVLYDLSKQSPKEAKNLESLRRKMYRVHEDALQKIAKGWGK